MTVDVDPHTSAELHKITSIDSICIKFYHYSYNLN